MKKLIIDCDNTFGVKGCDIDDGLAILYAFGSKNCEILGITTTFGNNGLDVVYPNTVRFMKDIGKGNIPVKKGSEKGFEENQAAHFLVAMANEYAGELNLLATGSLTNLYHAYQIDPTFYRKINEISLMGGITAPLLIGKKVLNELNFSCHYEATYNVLTNGKSIKIATGNHCLDALFIKEQFDLLKESSNDFLIWLYEQAQYWFLREKEVFFNEGIYKWDVFAAAALLNPAFFDANETTITPDETSLKTGNLLGNGKPVQVQLPKLKNSEMYMHHVYDTYENYQRNE